MRKKIIFANESQLGKKSTSLPNVISVSVIRLCIIIPTYITNT